MSEIKLKPCPFCGGEAVIFYPDCTFPRVACKKCKTTSNRYDSIQEAVDEWNRRSEESEIKLKPCPFCGGSQVEIYSPYKGVYKVICLCGACGASSPDEKKAYMYWNRRAGDE